MKRLVSRPTTAVTASFNNLGDISSGPVALLFFNNVIFLSVSRLDRLISDIHGTGLGAWTSQGLWCLELPSISFLSYRREGTVHKAHLLRIFYR